MNRSLPILAATAVLSALVACQKHDASTTAPTDSSVNNAPATSAGNTTGTSSGMDAASAASAAAPLDSISSSSATSGVDASASAPKP